MVYDQFGNEYKLDDMKLCVGEGWHPIVERLYNLCEQYKVTVLQVKEKFGGLRFYVGEAPMIVHDAIEAAEAESETTCDQCGRPGMIKNKDGWLSCVCEEHTKEVE